jgi:hypothetical protein
MHHLVMYYKYVSMKPITGPARPSVSGRITGEQTIITGNWHRKVPGTGTPSWEELPSGLSGIGL